MLGLIIITHGNLALELKSAMEHIIGTQTNIEIFCIIPDDDIDIQKNNIQKTIKELNQGIKTDVFDLYCKYSESFPYFLSADAS